MSDNERAEADRNAQGLRKIFSNRFADVMAKPATSPPPNKWKEPPTLPPQFRWPPPPPPATLWTRITPYLLRGLKYVAGLILWGCLCAAGGFFLSSLLEQDVTPKTLEILDYGLYALLFILWMGTLALNDCAPETPLAKSSAAFWDRVLDSVGEEKGGGTRLLILSGFVIGLNVILVWHAESDAKWSARFFLALAAVLLLRVDWDWSRYGRELPERFRAAFLGAKFHKGVLITAALIAAGTLVAWYGNNLPRDVRGWILGDFVHWVITDFVGLSLKWIAPAFAVGLVLASLWRLLLPKAPPPYSGADMVRDQKTHGDAQPADADDLHTALQGKSADGRKQQAAQPSHDFDYPD